MKPIAKSYSRAFQFFSGLRASRFRLSSGRLEDLFLWSFPLYPLEAPDLPGLSF
jgi:hypothetical protein